MSNYGHHNHGDDSLLAQLREERARNARLGAELVLEREKVRQLEDAFNHKDNETWHQHETIETLKTELRNIATMAAQLQHHILAAGPGPATPPLPEPRLAALGPDPAAGPPPAASPAAQEAALGLEVALMDLEERLQQAVALVLDELNTRKAAEQRIRELEAQLATVRRRIGGTEG